MAPVTRFILNDREVRTAAPAGLLLLDYLRCDERLTGTKEGCKEGDCGACAVLIGELAGNAVRYLPVTSCLVPLAEAHGRHVVTIEGCNPAGGGLDQVQRAVVEHGGTQCGFCTPGIVVSLHGLLLDAGKGLSIDDVKYALSGHLCRCTGYRSLKDCAATLRRELGDALAAAGGDRIAALAAAGAIPEYFTTIPARLRALREDEAAAGNAAAAGVEAAGAPEVLIAGGTDLYVQRGEELPGRRVEALGRSRGLKGVRRAGGEFRIGALTTFEELGADPAVTAALPRIAEFNHLIASWQIRNRATLAGNIVNASPIGDFTALLLALDATVVLTAGDRRRSVPLREFYRGYKEIDLRPGELLTEVAFPDPAGARVNFEKVSKRTCLDIASVNSACSIRCAPGDGADGAGAIAAGTIAAAHFSLGGVAPVPLYLRAASQAVRGRALDPDTVREALRAAQGEIAPISDVRGSAAYKRLLARQLLIAHFVTLFPGRFSAAEFSAAGFDGGAPAAEGRS